MLNKNSDCPFCNRERLRMENRVIRETDKFLILENKYPVMKNTFATVIIENTKCEEHIGTYSIEYLQELLQFYISYYNELKNSSNYRSVVGFKNAGVFSGGSISHAHMQIIGLENDDYKESMQETNFEGTTIILNDYLEWNISTKPRTELYEFNIILKDPSQINELAAPLQKSVNFILHKLNPKFKSYNLVFYIEDDSIIIKVISRGPTSPLLLGFDIHQVPDNTVELAKELRHL